MHLGVHYPTDVAAGAFIGTASAFASYHINNWFWKKMDSRKKNIPGDY
jgi:membrane-associated phospholipid phosphatase